jgi:pimeloyl-[acyl-carrier protein] methyl ester esterase
MNDVVHKGTRRDNTSRDDTSRDVSLSDKVTCVFVHGWAMNGSVWESVISELPPWIDVIQVDLPGHGSMNQVRLDTLDGMAKTLSALVHRPVIWIGWSLGGLAVMRLSQLYPERVSAALLVATNPCFVSRGGPGGCVQDWSHAVEQDVFDQFAADLEADQDRTIRRFLALQVKGQEGAIQTVRQLQRSMQQRGVANISALRKGLDILKTADLRELLAECSQTQFHWVLGARDTLVPSCLAAVLADRFGQRHVSLYAGAGHAPFLSDPQRFIAEVVALAQGMRQYG